MSNEKNYDLVIKNVQIVRPNANGIQSADIGVQNGAFKRSAPNIEVTEAIEIYDGNNKLAFPGLVDAHMHTGIYNPLDQDAVIES